VVSSRRTMVRGRGRRQRASGHGVDFLVRRRGPI